MINENHRWGVYDKNTRQVVETFPTRSIAIINNNRLKATGVNSRLWDREAEESLPEIPQVKSIDSNANVQSVINTTTDVINRLFCTMYLLHQSFAGVKHLPETQINFSVALNRAVATIASTYPDLKHFDVTVTEQLVIVGNNEYTNSLLSFIKRVANTPVTEINPDNPPQYLIALTEQEDDEDDYFVDEDDDYVED